MLKVILNHVLLLLTLINIIIAAPGIPKGQWKQFLYTDGLSSNYIFDVENAHDGNCEGTVAFGPYMSKYQLEEEDDDSGDP